jgi:hypothetical protein
MLAGTTTRDPSWRFRESVASHVQTTRECTVKIFTTSQSREFVNSKGIGRPSLLCSWQRVSLLSSLSNKSQIKGLGDISNIKVPQIGFIRKYKPNKLSRVVDYRQCINVLAVHCWKHWVLLKFALGENNGHFVGIQCVNFCKNCFGQERVCVGYSVKTTTCSVLPVFIRIPSKVKIVFLRIPPNFNRHSGLVRTANWRTHIIVVCFDRIGVRIYNGSHYYLASRS